MQTRPKTRSVRPALLNAAALAMVLTLALTSAALAQTSDNSLVFPPTDSPFGMTYTDWSVAWWQWALARHFDGHPFIDPGFDCNGPNNGQSGPVWFLALSQLQRPEFERSCTIPANTAVFIGLVNVECSSLEEPFPNGTGGQTVQEQTACADFFADHIVVNRRTPFCEIDGETVANLGSFRFPSPQFTFTAPTPWIFGELGGHGTAVSDGYFLMLKPLSTGTHTLRCGGAFHFSGGGPIEFGNVYHLAVQ
jgi:hypothetical protein